MQHQERFLQAKKATLISAATNILLGMIKLAGGLFFHSHALAADGIHSFSDLLTDGMVYLASKYGGPGTDDSHPYGHQRIETAAILLLSLLLILVGIAIAWDSVEKLLHNTDLIPSRLAAPIAFLSLLSNEGLFHYTKYVGHKIQSDLIITNAWHHRSDAASSAVVLIGIIGSLAGYGYLDSIAAIIVSFLIIKMGWHYGYSSIKELVDTAVAPEIIADIKRIIIDVDGVLKIHQLRTRMMGRDMFIDLHIQVLPSLSVSEGHFIAQHVHQTLMQKVENIKDVTVHVDPEDDETCSPSLHLPKRNKIEETCLIPWRLAYPGIQSWALHYLDGRLTIDLICDKNFDQWEELKVHIENDPNYQPQIIDVRFYSSRSGD